MKEDSGIDLARPRAHGDAVKRRETHRAFDTAAVCQAAHGRAAAEMRHDHSARCHSWGDLAQALGDVFVGKPMKTVALDPIRIKTLRNGVMIRDGIVAVMKGGIE